jgi:regulator of protease activity HflC (stomatin/prohibitin superfamily)
MRSGTTGIIALLAMFVVAIIGYSSVFTVSQTQQALVVRLGKPVDVVPEPGLHFKAPFIDTVINIDKRILDLENPSQEVIASDQKRLVVDAFARYRIKDALRFYQSIGSIQAANIQLTTLLNASLRRVLGEVTFIKVVRDEREVLMARIREQLDKEADGYGIEVVDVRICRSRTARRFTSGCRPSGNAKPPSSAPRAARRRRRSGRGQTAKPPSSSPTPTPPPSRCAARATANATGCLPKPTARMRISSHSTAR